MVRGQLSWQFLNGRQYDRQREAAVGSKTVWYTCIIRLKESLTTAGSLEGGGININIPSWDILPHGWDNKKATCTSTWWILSKEMKHTIYDSQALRLFSLSFLYNLHLFLLLCFNHLLSTINTHSRYHTSISNNQMRLLLVSPEFLSWLETTSSLIWGTGIYAKSDRVGLCLALYKWVSVPHFMSFNPCANKVHWWNYLPPSYKALIFMITW